MGILHCGNTAVLAKAVFEKRAIRLCRLLGNTTTPAVQHAANSLGGVDAPPFLYGRPWAGPDAASHFLARDGLRVCLSPLNCQAMCHESVRIASSASDGLKIPTFFLGKGTFSFVYFNLSLAGQALAGAGCLAACAQSDGVLRQAIIYAVLHH